MSEKVIYALISIGVMSVSTYATRISPFLIFGNKEGKEPPKWISYLGNVLPPGIIALLIVYCIRNVEFLSGSHGIPELVCILICALLHIWKGNEFLSIFGTTALYMFLVQVVFV